MRTNWFGEDCRKVHVLYVSPEWAPQRGTKFDPEQFVGALADANVATIEFYIKDHHGISYNPTKIGNDSGQHWLKPLTEAAHRRGLKFIAYYSVGWDKWARERHPEWAMPDTKPEGVRQPVNPNSGYRQFAIEQLREIAEQAEIDGVFLDIFNGDENFLRDICSVVKSVRPQALITYNGAGGGREELNPYADFSSIEGHGPRYLWQSFICKMMRRERKPFEVTTPGHILGWAGWCHKPLSLLMVEAALVSSHGGSLTIGLNPYPDGHVPPAEIAMVGKVWSWLKERETYFVRGECLADVAVLVPRYHNLQGLHAALSDHHIQFEVVTPKAEFKLYPLVLLHDEARFDEETLKRLRAYVQKGGRLVAMGGSHEGLEDVLGIRVLGGIHYTQSFIQPQKDELKQNLIDVPLLVKGKAVRCEVTTGEAWASLLYPLAECTEKIFFGWSPCNPPGEDSGHPAVVRNRFGSGEAIYLAVPLAEELNRTIDSGATWLRQFLANVIDALLPARNLVTNAPPGVEVVLNQQEGRRVVHLVNTMHVLAGRYPVGDDEVQISGIKLRLREDLSHPSAKIHTGPDNKALTIARGDGFVTVEVPPFSVHAMVAIE